ncbi:hypothetical protein ACU4GD_17980 [Cupriavidus basilensis]
MASSLTNTSAAMLVLACGRAQCNTASIVPPRLDFAGCNGRYVTRAERISAAEAGTSAAP